MGTLAIAVASNMCELNYKKGCADGTCGDCTYCVLLAEHLKASSECTVHTVNVTVYGARGAVPQHRRVQVLAASDDDAMEKVLRIVTNNVSSINLDSEHVTALNNMHEAEAAMKATATGAATPSRSTPAYRQA